MPIKTTAVLRIGVNMNNPLTQSIPANIDASEHFQKYLVNKYNTSKIDTR